MVSRAAPCMDHLFSNSKSTRRRRRRKSAGGETSGIKQGDRRDATEDKPQQVGLVVIVVVPGERPIDGSCFSNNRKARTKRKMAEAFATAALSVGPVQVTELEAALKGRGIVGKDEGVQAPSAPVEEKPATDDA